MRAEDHIVYHPLRHDGEREVKK